VGRLLAGSAAPGRRLIGDRQDYGSGLGIPAVRPNKTAEVHLQWATGLQAHHSFGVLHRLDYNVWDAWLQPARVIGQTVAEGRPRRLTRNGVSYEMALLALSLAMGDAMPEEFLVVYQ
jgi:hypothetical protein